MPIVLFGTWYSANRLIYFVKQHQRENPEFLDKSQIRWIQILAHLQIGIAFMPFPYAVILLLAALGDAVSMGSTNLNLSYAIFLIVSVTCTMVWLGNLYILHRVKRSLNAATAHSSTSFLSKINHYGQLFTALSTVNTLQYGWLILLAPFISSLISPDMHHIAQLMPWPSLTGERRLVIKSSNSIWTAHWLTVKNDNPCSSLVWSTHSEVIFCRDSDKYISAYSVKTDDHFNESLFLDYAYTLDSPPNVPQDMEGKIVYYIRQGASAPNMLFSAIDITDIAAVKTLLGFIKDINDIHAHDIFAAYDGTTLLGKAFDHAQIEPVKSAQIVKLLLEAGADPNQATTNQFCCYYPLEETAGNGNYEIVKLLVEHGADVTVDDNSPISRAYGPDKQKIIQYLIEHGADPSKITPNN